MAVPLKDLDRAIQTFEAMVEDEGTPFNTLPEQSYKPITLLKCAYKEVHDKAEFLGFVFHTIYNEKYGQVSLGLDAEIAVILDEYGEGARFERELQAPANVFYNTFCFTNQNVYVEETKSKAITFFKMFGPAAANLIDRIEIDTPVNAMTLTASLHSTFGTFRIYFEHMEGNTFKVKSWNRPSPGGVPCEVTLRQHGDSKTDLPSYELLEVHRAIGHILHMSAAAESIDLLHEGLEEGTVDADILNRMSTAGGTLPAGVSLIPKYTPLDTMKH
ncbi:MAG: hypothetical protein Q9163_000645 [Psora crenata]